MKNIKSHYPLVIIGAGAAGLGASEQASSSGIDHIVLEASHRVGGRGLTEYLENSIPVDLGCHWMHCASKNPYVKWAEKLGFEYEIKEYDFAMHFDGNWLGERSKDEFNEFIKNCYHKMEVLHEESSEKSVFDGIDSESRWASQMYYWMSVMHSNDTDQVSIQDVVDFDETNEDWPVLDGYGALIAKQGEDCPVSLNTQLKRIDWSHSPIKLTTNLGTMTADKIIITVSTGVLGSGQIEFYPELPAWKRDAISALPLGNYNYQFFSAEPNTFDPQIPENIHYNDGETALYIRTEQVGKPCIFTNTAGRFAWWLEKQGTEASKDFFENVLVNIFGGEIRNNLREFKVSAWGYDPWVQGAYSSQLPGYTGMRQQLAQPIDELLYFAGEATSINYLNTAHGAYLSGKRAVKEG